MEWGTRNKEFAQVGLDIEAWQKYYNRNQQQYIRRRLDAIRLFWEGKPRRLIAQELAMSYKTLSSYLDLYKQGGLVGLVSPIVKPRLHLLTAQQMEKVKDIVLHEHPQAYSKKETSGH
jgi:transposase